MALNGKVATALLSDPGRVRQNNEDAVAQDARRGLLILADGMGGYLAGEVASGIAVETILKHARAHWKKAFPDEDAPLTGLPMPATELLRDAIEAANGAILEKAATDEKYKGMGTTVVCCLLHGGGLAVAHVGDSRLYRLRDDQLAQLTRDHSLVEELIARGHITRADARKFARKNVVTRALGIEPDVAVETQELDLQRSDVLLLCSDGLSDMLEDDALCLTLARNAANLPKAARALVDQANERGGKDNISVVLARVDQRLAPSRPVYKRLLDWI